MERVTSSRFNISQSEGHLKFGEGTHGDLGNSKNEWGSDFKKENEERLTISCEVGGNRLWGLPKAATTGIVLNMV